MKAAARSVQAEWEAKLNLAWERLKLEEWNIAQAAEEAEAKAAESGHAAHLHAFVVTLSFIANIGCTVGKLFPGQYICHTWKCNEMVHTAFMTLAAGTVDVFERLAFLNVLVPDQGKILYCIPLGGLQRVILKTTQLCVTLVWTLWDLQTVLTTAPGSGTISLTAFACIIQLVLIVLDFRASILTERLNRQQLDAGYPPARRATLRVRDFARPIEASTPQAWSTPALGFADTKEREPSTR